MQYLNLALLALAAFPATGSAKVHGVVIFSRHGDRTSKVIKGYGMTRLGAEQLFNSGSFYRERYIEDGAPQKIVGIASDQYDPTQFWASGPDQAVLLSTATNFLQGLYPPLSTVNTTLETQKLANGSTSASPLGGYQYVQVHSEDEKDPDTIYLKGSDSCPAWTVASSTYKNSTSYLSLLASTKFFYAQFNNILASTLSPSKISFANAYDVFDLLNTASIHNNTNIVTPAQLDQARYLANTWESNMNFNASQPDRAIGGASLAGAFLKQLNETVASSGQMKFSLMTGSYNVFLAFFGLTNLTTINTNFTGLPDYASSIVFELSSTTETDIFPAEKDLTVRFLFRNGTDSSDKLTAYPLFNQTVLELPYLEFRQRMEVFAVKNPKQWCAACKQTKGFCSQPEYSATLTTSSSNAATPSASTGEDKKSGMSNAVAGVIGAVVTLGVLALVAGVVFLLRRRKNKTALASVVAERKGSQDGASSIDTRV